MVGVFLIAISAFAGWNEYTTAQDGSILDVTLTVNDTAIGRKLSNDEIDTLRFTRGNGMSSVKLLSDGGNDLAGGIIADGFNIKIRNPNVLGTGPVRLLNQWSALYGESASPLSEIDVYNRVVFDTIDSFVAGENAKPLILHNIGVTDKNSAKVVALGRTGTGQASVTLALDGADNDPIGYFNLRGDLALTLDGGTIRAAATGGTRALFQTTSQATPAITVLNAPLTVDVAEGGDVWFGVSPTTYSKAHSFENVVEEYTPDNYSFESGNTGWTFSDGSVQSNGSNFDSNNTYPTTNGTKYAMVRHDATLSRTINLPASGFWQVVLERGCRGSDYSKGISATVKVAGEKVLDIPGVDTAEGFTEFRSEPVQLFAGEQSFLIELGSGTSNNAQSYGSLNFDAIRFERCESTTPNFALAKTGAGSLTLTGSDFPSATSNLEVEVSGGTLVVSDVALMGNSFTVENGGDLKFSGVTAANANVTVASGGTVTFGKVATELVANGSFETPVVSAYGFQWPSACQWTFKPDSTQEERQNSAGIQHNGSAVTQSADQTPYGNQSLYLRTGSTAEQSISIPATGRYLLSFWQAPRNYASSHELDIKVLVDGTEVVVNAGKAGRYEPYRTERVLTLTQGSHALKFECASGGGEGSMVFIDDVSLVAVASFEANDFSTATLSLASGSTVRLNRSGQSKVHVGTVLVDGVKVRGGKSALQKAGVTVEGEGRIQCGAPFGLTVRIY